MEPVCLDIPDQMNAATYFVDRVVAGGGGDRTALALPDRSYTYQQLLYTINRVGNGLRELGVEVENRVLMVLPDDLPFVATYWGAMKIGAVPVPVNVLFDTHQYEFLLNDSRAKVLVTDAEFWPKLEPALARAPFLRHVILVGGEGGPVAGIPVHRWDALVSGASPTLEAMPMSRDDMAYWLYSSGTTGFPKGVVHLHHDLLWCQFFARHVLDLQPDDRIFATSKLFFAYALGSILHMSAFHGCTSLLWPERPQPETVARFIEQQRPTVLFSVPSFYAAFLRSDAVRPEQFQSVRLCLSAGEPLAPELYRRWQERFGIELCDGIGATEMVYTFISNRPGHVRPGSSGQPVPGAEIRIVDEAGRDLPPGEQGNLLVKAEFTCGTYWRQHERNKDAFLGRWFRTGDVYVRDDDGYYYYAGRSDDLFKVSGQFVSPVEVENTLLEHPAVTEAAVIGAPDADGNLKPKAFVVLQDRAQPGPDLVRGLQEHVRERIAHYKTPRWVEFVAALPRTATGKVQRYKLRAGAV